MATDEEQLKQLEDQLQLLLKKKEVVDAQKKLEEAQKMESERLKQLKDSSEILEQQKTMAENQKAIAEAQKATIAATFPKGETKPLEGDITTSDKFGYIAELVAYQSTKEKAEEVGKKIDTLVTDKRSDELLEKVLLKTDKILIVNELDFASGDLALIQVNSMLALFEEGITTQNKNNDDFLEENKPTKIKPELKVIGGIEIPKMVAGIGESTELMTIPTVVPTIPTIALGIISSIAEIMGYFQINYDIKGQDFTLDQQAIVSIVADNIKKIQVYVYNFNMIENSPSFNKIIKIIDLRRKLDASTERIKSEIINKTNEDIAKMKEKIQQLETKTKQTGKNRNKADSPTELSEQEKKDLDNAKKLLSSQNNLVNAAEAEVSNSESLSKAFSNFIDSITKAVDEKTLPLLAKAALREYIHENKITHLLNLRILSSGGEAITQKSRFRSGNTAFIGGNVISYILAKKTGEIVIADTLIGLAHLNYQLSANKDPLFKRISLGSRW